jgi:hypothetical protein
MAIQNVPRDNDGATINHYFNPSIGEYEVVQGSGGALNSKCSLQVGGADVSQSDPLPTSQASLTAVAGKTVVTTAGTAITMGSQACNGVFVIANPLNTGAMYIFPAAGVKTSVIPLQAGDSDFWPVTNISALEVDSAVSGESIFWKGAV